MRWLPGGRGLGSNHLTVWWVTAREVSRTLRAILWLGQSTGGLEAGACLEDGTLEFLIRSSILFKDASWRCRVSIIFCLGFTGTRDISLSNPSNLWSNPRLGPATSNPRAPSWNRLTSWNLGSSLPRPSVGSFSSLEELLLYTTFLELRGTLPMAFLVAWCGAGTLLNFKDPI